MPSRQSNKQMAEHTDKVRGGPASRHASRLATSLALLLATLAAGSGASASKIGARVERKLERIRQATDQYHDIAAAHDAGYPTELPNCIEKPPEGGMGYHYAHPDLLDARLDIERPEILVYAPTGNGELKLAGVEYIVPFSAWQQEWPPSILGRDLKRSDSLQLWYLHVWIWEENSAGVFADWNPAVSCSP